MATNGFMGKAEESLASAGDDLAAARYNACARNAYYAAFQAAVAALKAEGVGPRGRWGHDFVQAEFQGRLVYRRKLYDARFRTVLSDLFARRSRADYSEDRITAQQARASVTEAAAMLREIKRRTDGDL
jgi:uncharacterized protein (UPF0332 family)